MSDRIIMNNKQINTSINNDEQTTLSKIDEYSYYSNYMLESVSTQHTNRALHKFGLLGGPVNNDSYVNVIDLESKLLGINNKTKYNTDENKVNIQKKNKLNEFQLINFKESIV